MTLEEALLHKEIPPHVRESLAIVDVPYVSFSGETKQGQLVVHKDLAADVEQIFQALFEARFPIDKMIPIVAYDWDDDRSMEDNNTSAFNYRLIFGTDRLSNHSYGRAIDINPLQNPYVRRDGAIVPPGSRYDVMQKGTVTKEVVSLFSSFGWKWGGDWVEVKDYQHFEKLS